MFTQIFHKLEEAKQATQASFRLNMSSDFMRSLRRHQHEQPQNQLARVSFHNDRTGVLQDVHHGSSGGGAQRGSTTSDRLAPFAASKVGASTEPADRTAASFALSSSSYRASYPATQSQIPTNGVAGSGTSHPSSCWGQRSAVASSVAHVTGVRGGCQSQAASSGPKALPTLENDGLLALKAVEEASAAISDRVLSASHESSSNLTAVVVAHLAAMQEGLRRLQQLERDECATLTALKADLCGEGQSLSCQGFPWRHPTDVTYHYSQHGRNRNESPEADAAFR